MGGLGSGSRWSKKGVVEQCHSLDTATLKRWKLLVPGTAGRTGSFRWGRGDSGNDSSVGYVLTVGADGGSLRLLYSLKSQNAELDYSVRLVTTPCHLGGVRWWFLCPLATGGAGCGRRVRKLYLRGRYFGCRRCHDLAYTSSQQSDGRVYAAVRDGLDLGGLADLRGWSASRLGFALKVLTFERLRLDRLDKRMGRTRRAGRPGVETTVGLASGPDTGRG